MAALLILLATLELFTILPHNSPEQIQVLDLILLEPELLFKVLDIAEHVWLAKKVDWAPISLNSTLHPISKLSQAQVLTLKPLGIQLDLVDVLHCNCHGRSLACFARHEIFSKHGGQSILLTLDLTMSLTSRSVPRMITRMRFGVDSLVQGSTAGRSVRIALLIQRVSSK